MQISEITQVDFANWIVHFARKGWFRNLEVIWQLHSQLEDDFVTWFTTWRWFRTLVGNLEMILHLGSQLGDDFATWFHSCEDGISTCEVAHVCLQMVSHLRNTLRNFRKLISQLQNFRKERLISQLISQLRNFRSTWCGCFQMAITSSFQLRFTHCLKHWTSNFPSFETTYSMHKMDSKKCLKCILQLLSSWISC